MLELIALIESWAQETLPSFLGILGLSLIIGLALAYLLSHTRPIIQQVKSLWFVQTVGLVIAVLALKTLALSAFDLAAGGREAIDQISQTILWLLGAYLANQALQLFVWDDAFVRKYKTAAPELLSALAAAGLYVVAVYGIMTFTFDRPMTGFIVSSGIVIGVVGLAMQSALSDLVAGVALSIERPFTIGEWVELDDGTIGEVVDINWRATHILSRHASLYILPNARVSNARVHNFSRPDPSYRTWIYVHVPSTASPIRVRRVLLQAAIESPRVLNDPAPVARLSEAGGSYRYTVAASFEGYEDHRIGIDDLLCHIWIHCARHGIVPSAVTREVILRQGVAEEITEPSPHDLLGDAELFSVLSDASRSALVAGMKVRPIAASTEIVVQGDHGASLFLISAGLVAILIDVQDGQRRQVAMLGAGQYFGEMSLLAGEPRTATVVAHTECQVLEIDKDALQPVFDTHPELMESMARIVSQRRLSNQTLEQDVTEDDLAHRLNAIAANLLDRMKSIFA